MGWIKRHWLALLSALPFAPPLFKGIKGLVGLGGDADFIISRSQEPGWVGMMLAWLTDPPGWSILPMILAGLGLIYWDAQRSVKRHATLRAPSPPVLPPARSAVRNPQPVLAAPAQAPIVGVGTNERIFIPEGVSLEDLAMPFRSKTDVDARAVTARYIGRWTRVFGIVHNITAIKSETVMVTYKVHFFNGPIVFMYFMHSHALRAVMLSKEMRFTVIGRVDAIESSRIILNGCEFEAMCSRPNGEG